MVAGGVTPAKSKAAEQRRQTGGVVADPGRKHPGAILLRLADGPRGKDGVEMGGEEEQARIRRVRGSGALAEYVAFLVQVDVPEAERAEPFRKPLGPRPLGKGRSGNPDHLEQPMTQLRLVEVQPVEGAVNGRERGQRQDAPMGDRGGGAVHRGVAGSEEAEGERSSAWR